jgi:hypothetical protein
MARDAFGRSVLSARALRRRIEQGKGSMRPASPALAAARLGTTTQLWQPTAFMKKVGK